MAQQRTDFPLLTTKMAIPPVRSALVPRPRLLERLDACLSYPLALLAAPAGFGKTIIASSWAHNHPHTVAWVSLDNSDNDPIRFWSYVLAALEKLHPGISANAIALLHSEQPAPIETVLIALLNALQTLQQDSILALDDYHVIETPAIHQHMTFLLDHLPPQFHLLLTSRVDPPLPLSRLRARHSLVELRADDLRFTLDEAATFLHTVMGLRLPPEHIAVLEERTEGWIAGLQLAALSMQGRKDAESFVSTFAGSHRYIIDYLTEEVLRQQPELLRTFLLQTSILERLNASLCDAVLQQPHSQATLERLEQANLFLLPLDDERNWYRYHHLFAEALRFQLTQAYPDLPPTLHDRASVWFEQHTFPLEAVNHALAARNFERAAALIEPILFPMFNRGTHATVRQWLKSLPEEVLFTRPYLCLQYAWAFLFVGDIVEARRMLQVAEQLFQTQGDSNRLGEVYTLQSSIALILGDATSSIDYAERALSLLPENDLVNRCNCTAYLGGSFFISGNANRAAQLLQQARTLCQTCHPDTMLYAMDFLTRLEITQGKLRQSAETSHEILRLLSNRPSIHTAHAFSTLARLARERNELDQAIQYAQQSINAGEQIGLYIYLSPIYLNAARVHWTAGEQDRALTLLQQAEYIAQELGNPTAIEQAKAFRMRLELAQGHLQPVEQWLTEIGLPENDEPSYNHQDAYLILARLRLAQHRASEILPLLSRLLPLAEADGRTGDTITLLPLHALTLQQSGNNEAALQTLDRLLALAQPENYIRIFLNEGSPMRELLARWLASPSQQVSPSEKSSTIAYTQKLLDAFPQAEPAANYENIAVQPKATSKARFPLLEPLTAREQDTLELLAAGLSNTEIAERLVVGVGTVKTHIKSIYGKLGVHSRTQAIVRARESGLL